MAKAAARMWTAALLLCCAEGSSLRTANDAGRNERLPPTGNERNHTVPHHPYRRNRTAPHRSGPHGSGPHGSKPHGSGLTQGTNAEYAERAHLRIYRYGRCLYRYTDIMVPVYRFVGSLHFGSSFLVCIEADFCVQSLKDSFCNI